MQPDTRLIEYWQKIKAARTNPTREVFAQLIQMSTSHPLPKVRLNITQYLNTMKKGSTNVA